MNSVRWVIRPASYWSTAHSANARASIREQRQWVMAQAMQCPWNLLDTAITSVTEAEDRVAICPHCEAQAADLLVAGRFVVIKVAVGAFVDECPEKPIEAAAP